MEDTIKRSDAIKVTWQEPSYTDAINALTEVRERIKSIPSAEKQGEWIDKGWHGDWQFETDGRGNCWKVFECSNCNCSVKYITPFCPQCGARMTRSR